MDDLISRQAAIDKINERQRRLIYCFGFKNDLVKIMNIAKSIIIAIPSAQPEIVRCKDCKWFGDIGCAISIVDDTDKPSEEDYCSFAERRTDELGNS